VHDAHEPSAATAYPEEVRDPEVTTSGTVPPNPDAVEVVDERIAAGPGIALLGRRSPSLLRQQVNLAARNAVAGVAGVGIALISPLNSPLSSARPWALVGVAMTVALLLHLFAVALPAYERETSSVPSRRVIMLGIAAAFAMLLFGDAPRRGVQEAILVGAAVVLMGWLPTLPAKLRRGQSSALIIGDRMSVYHLVNQWRSRSEIDIVGVCLAETDDDAPNSPDEILGIPVVGRLENAAGLAVQAQVGQVVVAPGPTLTAYDVRRLSWALEDTTIELTVAAEVHGALPHRITPRVLGRRLVLSVRPSKRSAVATWIKCVLDRMLAAVLVVVFAPLMAGLWLAVRVDSPGPGFFVQQRAGKEGRLFPMVKLRTMTVDAEQRRAELVAANEGAGPLFKMTSDPRVTRVGKWLRVTSLDELPQLFNVVRGEMSLIGPRPALPSEIATYDPWTRRRLSIKPGMTGLWQVSGRSNLPWDEAVRLDLDYVDNWTHGSDFSIVARTVRAVVRRDGAH
jgi:exopolysaccharide biosynthesis polyprenyl glycosylphosphotransferase